jgi:twitching motility protein PilT
MHIDDLLRDAVEKGASDVHLAVSVPPMVRIDGELVRQNGMTGLTEDDMEQILKDTTNEEQRIMFAQEWELDFAYDLPEVGRFRGNACIQRGTTSMCFRALKIMNLDIESLGLPQICKDLALKEHGLVLITGPAGSGKSTTLAAMIKHLNGMHNRRVITIEDPVEFVHENDKCLITQREVGTDTMGFAAALKHALRQDPNVVLVGELRDLETIATALTAAETGHLILTTLHTPSAPQAIDRMIDVFPPYQQQQVRVQLSTCLQAVLYQTLIPRRDGKGRIVAVEVMLATDAIRNLIREARTPQMWSAMQTSSRVGMQTIDQSLMQLCHKRVISLEDALRRCREPESSKRLLARNADND